MRSLSRKLLSWGPNRGAVLPLTVSLLFGCSAGSSGEARDAEEVGIEQSELASAAIPLTLHAVLVRNDDGAVGNSPSCAAVAAMIPNVNAIFASSKISFNALDQTRDCTIVNSTALNVDDVGGAGVPHQALRDAVARKYPNKVVLLFRNGDGGFSSSLQNFVVLGNGADAVSLAHEIGHYLGLSHTHPGDSDGITYTEAVTTIRNAVNSGQVSLANGADALQVYDDGVSDTPIDLGAKAYIGAMPQSDWCTHDLPLTVSTNFGVKTYLVKPPYSNPMSYWRCPGTAFAFSPIQIQMMHRLLFQANRAHVRKGIVAARPWSEPYASPSVVSRGPDEIIIYATSTDGRPYSRVWRSASGYDAAWFDLQGSTRAGYGYTPQAIFQPFTMYRNTTEIDVFSMFMDGHAQSKVFSNATGAYFPSNTEWFDQGVTAAATGPSGAARSATSFMIGLRANDGTLYARNYDSSGYGAWTGLGGKGETRPTLASQGSSSHMFARWNDGSIRHLAWSSTQGWGGTWEHLGGSGEGSPAAIGDGQNIDVFATFDDRSIRTRTLNNTGWDPSQGWNILTSGGWVASQPTALFAGTTKALLARGTEGGVWLSTKTGAIWGSWLSAGGRTIGAPAAVARTPTEIDIYARWYDGSIKARVRDLAAGTWWPTSGWYDLGTPPGATLPSPVNACPALDVNAPNTAFCSAGCPCDVGEGDCDSDNECQTGLKCVHQGASFGLPSTYDVCVPIAPAYDPDNRSATFCSSTAPCDIGQGGCQTDNDCKPGLVCVLNHGTDYGAPASWDFCDVAP